MMIVTIANEDEEMTLHLNEIDIYNSYQLEYGDEIAPSDEELIEFYLNKYYPDTTSYWIEYA